MKLEDLRKDLAFLGGMGGAFALFLNSEYSVPPGSKPEFDYTLF